MLSRQQMEEIVKRGESVGYQGRIISRVEDLPSETELAGLDEKSLEQILQAHDREIARISADRARTVEQLEKAREARQQGMPLQQSPTPGQPGQQTTGQQPPGQQPAPPAKTPVPGEEEEAEETRSRQARRGK